MVHRRFFILSNCKTKTKTKTTTTKTNKNINKEWELTFLKVNNEEHRRNLLWSAPPCSTLNYSALLYSALLYSAPLCSALLCSAPPCSAPPCSAPPCTLLYSTVLFYKELSRTAANYLPTSFLRFTPHLIHNKQVFQSSDHDWKLTYMFWWKLFINNLENTPPVENN